MSLTKVTVVKLTDDAAAASAASVLSALPLPAEAAVLHATSSSIVTADFSGPPVPAPAPVPVAEASAAVPLCTASSLKLSTGGKSLPHRGAERGDTTGDASVFLGFTYKNRGS
jgi:hypothetical protein